MWMFGPTHLVDGRRWRGFAGIIGLAVGAGAWVEVCRESAGAGRVVLGEGGSYISVAGAWALLPQWYWWGGRWGWVERDRGRAVGFYCRRSCRVHVYEQVTKEEGAQRCGSGGGVLHVGVE